VHTPTFQVNENTAVTRHRKWRWWTSKLTDLPDQNPVSFNIVYRLLLIDRADEGVDSFQKRPTKTPFHFCVTSFARLAFSFSSRALAFPGIVDGKRSVVATLAAPRHAHTITPPRVHAPSTPPERVLTRNIVYITFEGT
jgi:hypothetical protein